MTRLRQARQEAGFKSARAAAMRHNWTPSTYASHENGQTPVPREAATTYAKAFKVAPAWLLGIESSVSQPPRSDHRERAYAPRGLRREAAADYIGMSATKFDEMVRDGRMPKPKRVDGCVVWDRYRLDSAFDALPGDDAEVDTWADVTAWPRVK